MNRINIKPENLQRAELLFDTMYSISGSPIAKKRRLLLDYKDSTGADRHSETVAYFNVDMTEQDFLKNLKESVAQQGYKLSSAIEFLPNSMRCLYLAPGYLEESMRDLGLPVPSDMKANTMKSLKHTGLPINWDELCEYWEQDAKS